MTVQNLTSRGLSIALALLFCLTSNKLLSQEYKYEIGGGAGISSYVGDANQHRPFLHPGLAGGAQFRYNINLQWALKATVLGGSIAGDTQHSGNRYPMGNERSFQRTFAEMGTQLEFHFLRFSNEYGYLAARPYTPYVFTGVGITVAGGENTFLGANVPLGVGFKYKLKNRMNIGAEISMRKLFRDDLDVVRTTPDWSLDAPFGIKSSPLKNQDWYSFALIYLTWDFGLRKDPCR